MLATAPETIESDPAVYYHQGQDFVLLDMLKNQLAYLPDLSDLRPEAKIEDAVVGDPAVTTTAEEQQLRKILRQHKTIFLGEGNALPPPARGVVCDLDVGDARPIAQRARRISPDLLPKVYELIKRLLETGLIERSLSEWASPIVIVMKKNGTDIRLCIDYRAVNQLIKLMPYPLPLIDELMSNFAATMWFMTLDMASGFWAVPMTTRAKLISAFICPLGHFQWKRMPFGLKNAPLIYQRLLDNCLWGFTRLSPAEERLVDPDVLEFLGIEPGDDAPNVEASKAEQVSQDTRPRGVVAPRNSTDPVFHQDRVAPEQMGPVLSRSSYIDDIIYGASSWGDLCKTLNALLYRLRYWNISVSLPKSEFGVKKCKYLGHDISSDGIRTSPKLAQKVLDLPFPSTLKGVQSFLGSLNYYSKFIEDLPVIAAVLYELSDEQLRAGRDLEKARHAFKLLKERLVSTPLLQHPDPERQYVIILHANKWAISAVLGQDYDGVVRPVRFVGRVLQDAELRYHPAEKEVLALLRVLNTCHTMVTGCKVKTIKVYTRYSVLGWLFKSKTVDGRCLKWAVNLSPWDLDIRRVEKDEDGLAAILGAGITPREQLDEMVEELIPSKGARIKTPPVSLEMLSNDHEGFLLSFDGAAKRDGSGGAAYILWELPSWEVVAAEGHILEKATVNEADYAGMIRGMQLAKSRNIQELVVVGDSRLAIQQLQGVIGCTQPHLQKLLQEADELREQFRSLRLVHVKRDFNAAADYISKRVLQDQASLEVTDPGELKLLQGLNRIHEKLMKEPKPRDRTLVDAAFRATARSVGASSPADPGQSVYVTTRSEARRDAPRGPDESSQEVEEEEESAQEVRGRRRYPAEVDPGEARRERWRRICVHQAADPHLAPLRSFLRGETEKLSLKQTTHLAKIADQFVLDSQDTLFYVSRNTPERPRNEADRLRLVVPRDLQEAILHHCHSDMQGGHQGIIRTYERLRREFYWIGMFKATERFIKECVDCVTAKGLPRNPGPSPGNILATRPFQVVSMDFVIPLPKTARGNEALLLFQCAFSGFIMCKAMKDTSAQDVAEAYEEQVFRRFGASEMIRHDQDPRFMARVFKHFREMMGSRQRATLAYRPQANGQQERSVQTVIRSVRAYVQTVDQSDWDELAEKLMWALNTSYDFTRLDTPFYLVHGWDAQGTVQAMMGDVPRDLQLRDAYEWRLKVQRQVEYARAWARDLQAKAKTKRAREHNQRWKQLSDRLKEGFEVGDSVWLYLARVRPGLTKKLAHLWHGPFRILEKSDDFRYKLQVEGTDYRFHPWVHVSRLKPRALFPERPQDTLNIPEEDDFDTALLREDSWEPDEAAGEFEVEAILDVRWVTRTRTSRRIKEYKVKWKGYDAPEWIPQGRLNCGRLLYEFDKGERARARFQAMQSGDELPDEETQ